MEKRTTEIVIQTCERIFVRKFANDLHAFCPTCQTETVFIVPEQAAGLMKTGMRTVFRLIESGSIHFIETNGGLMFICRQSLVKQKFVRRILETKGEINMTVYMVERDLPGISMEQLAAAQQAAIETGKQFTANGKNVRYIRTTFVPNEARCMCLFEADSEDLVKK